jgi:hypothetical protein
MKCKATWLLVLGVWACLAGRTTAVEPGPKVYVVQPDTDRRVYLADLSVRTESGQPVPVERTKMRTGRYGEPVLPKDAVDPRYGTLVLKARKHHVTGRLTITYDPDQYFWKQAYDPQEDVWTPDHNRGNWRPDMVYQWNLDPADEEQEQGRWTSQSYAEWKAAQVAAEQRRIAGHQDDFLADVDNQLIEAVGDGLIDASGQAKIRTAAENLIATDLKAPLDRALSEAVSDAIDQAIGALEQPGGAPPADPEAAPRAGDTLRRQRDLQSQLRRAKDLKTDLENALGSLIRQIRTNAPKPPAPRVMMERRYRVPVRRGGYCLPATGGVVLPPIVCSETARGSPQARFVPARRCASPAKGPIRPRQAHAARRLMSKREHVG